MKPFSLLAGLLLVLVAAAHAWRLYTGMPIELNGEAVPAWVSWVGLAVPGIIGLMTIAESRR